MEEQQYQYDLFISYAEDGQAWVRGYLEPKLRRAGKTYLLEDDLVAGQSWASEAERAIQLSLKVVFVITPQHVAERGGAWVEQMAHVRGAENGEWSLLPVLLKPVDPTLLQRTLRFIDLTDELGKEDAEQRLLQDVGLGDGSKVAEQPKQSPYPGMKPFDIGDAHYFFGREQLVEECRHYLRNNHFLALIGSSGCGKSSLVRAGIVPPLQRDRAWVVKILRPGQGVFDAWVQQYGQTAFDEPGKLVNHLLTEKTDAQCLLMVVDQFEEVFALDRQETNQQQNGLGAQAQLFLQRLAALRCEENVSIILTVRDEFFSQLALCSKWLNIDDHLQRVGSLDRQGLADAIRRPAEKVNVWIDDVLIERLVNDAGDDPGILPFVQETMNLLWEQKEESFISLQQYEKLKQGGVSGLRYAIAAKADSAFKALPSDAHSIIARRIFIRLVQFGDGGRPDTRRSQPVSRLQATQDPQGAFGETLQHLTSERYRLLTLSGEEHGQETVVDIVHESLIKAWPKLVEWVEHSKEFEEKRRYLLQKASEWDELYKRKSGFLDKGQIQYAKSWLQHAHKDYEYIDNILHQYIDSSFMFHRANKIKYTSIFLLIISFLPLYFLSKFTYNLFLKTSALQLNELIKIDGGTYQIGSSYNKYEKNYFQGTIDISQFWIEKFEVSNESYCLCIKAGVCSTTSNINNVCDELTKKYPVVNVTLRQANDYCGWIGRRVPNEIEWEVAARTKNNFTYPVGNDISQLNININKNNLIDRESESWPTNQVGDDISSLGIFGLTGNVSEWTSSLFKFSCSHLFSEENNYVNSDDFGVVIKGGSMHSLPEGATVFYRDSSINESADIGVRCISSFSPSSILNSDIKECYYDK